MKILYFAKIREEVGVSSEELSGFKTIQELKFFLDNKYPNIFDKTTITAVNMEVINKNIKLKEADEIAFYPPVTGG